MQLADNSCGQFCRNIWFYGYIYAQNLVSSLLPGICGWNIGNVALYQTAVFVSGKEKEVRRRRDKSGTTLFITIRKERRWDTKNLFHICMLIAMVIPFILLVKYAYSSEFQAQGRYLMPMLIPFMYFITLGYENIMDRFVKKEIYRKWTYIILSVLYIISAVAVYYFVFKPNYS